ncbi:MAG: hypothetical protein LBV75_00825 [Paludibacter sp.]|jgi:hypothetical protein|nr:hypothetical protein [Paludibacter sp.]
MLIFLIITGIVIVAIFIIKTINVTKQKQNKNELQDLVNKVNKAIFPNGKSDIEAGTKELLRILNNKVDKETAQTIFLKSSSICYTTSLNNEFSKERLEQHLSHYALHYFDDKSLNDFYAYLLSKNDRANILDKLTEFSKLTNPDGTDQEEMPEGYGEFGIEITNPIPVRSIPDSYFYLRKLKTTNGESITFDRIGSRRAPNIANVIDAYRISVNGKQIATIYICPYNKATSKKAPKGFKLA